MRKFKIGDRVKCIGTDNSYSGYGWELGREFTINFISEGRTANYCFPGKDDNGVDEKCLELSQKDWD